MNKPAIRISNINGNSYQKDAVRVYLGNKLIGEVFPPKRNPLKYLQDHPGSQYRADLIAQCAEHGITLNLNEVKQ